MPRNKIKAGLVDRLRFNGNALAKGWPVAWALVTVAALVIGFSALAAIAFALDAPILALALLLAGLLLTLAEGGYRLVNRERLRADEGWEHASREHPAEAELGRIQRERAIYTILTRYAHELNTLATVIESDEQRSQPPTPASAHSELVRLLGEMERELTEAGARGFAHLIQRRGNFQPATLDGVKVECKQRGQEIAHEAQNRSRGEGIST